MPSPHFLLIITSTMEADNSKTPNLSRGLANLSIDHNNSTVSTEVAQQNRPLRSLTMPMNNLQAAAFQEIEDQIAPNSQHPFKSFLSRLSPVKKEWPHLISLPLNLLILPIIQAVKQLSNTKEQLQTAVALTLKSNQCLLTQLYVTNMYPSTFRQTTTQTMMTPFNLNWT